MKRASQTIILISGLFSIYSSAVFAVPEAQDLRYGVALYHYYQQDYAQSLTELMVGEEVGDINFHQVDADLLKAGMSLSYGLTNQANDLFNEVLEQHADKNVQNRAWFYMAKLKARQGDQAAVAQALANIDGDLSADLEAERRSLAADQALQNGFFSLADEQAKEIPEDSVWSLYYQYNRALAKAVEGDWQSAASQFSQFSNMTFYDEEALALKDKAMTSAGFAWLELNEFDLAQQQFQQVRLESPFSSEAMLGYGRASALSGNYNQAIQYWQPLQQGDLMDASVQESLLSYPYALEQLELPGAALKSYLQADLRINEAIVIQSELMTLLEQQSISDLLGLSVSESQDWLTQNNDEFQTLLNGSLVELMSQQSIQNQVSDLQSLYPMIGFTNNNQQRVDVLAALLQEREQKWQQDFSGKRYADLNQLYLQLSVQMNTVELHLASLDPANDLRPLMTDDELELYQRIEDSLARLPQLEQGGEQVDEQGQQLLLYKGMLEWQVLDQWVPRQWQFKRQLESLQQLQEEAEQALAAVEQASADPGFEGYSQRLNSMSSRLDSQYSELQAKVEQQEILLVETIQAELEGHKQRLFSLQGYARLAIARLYDLGQEPLAL